MSAEETETRNCGKYGKTLGCFGEHFFGIGNDGKAIGNDGNHLKEHITPDRSATADDLLAEPCVLW